MDIQHEQQKFILAHLDHMSDELRAMYLQEKWVQAALQRKGVTTTMNKAQARHAHAMARKIETQAQSIVYDMQALQRDDLATAPLSVVYGKLKDMEGYIRSIQSIVTDMLPSLPEQ
jgi:hypothetical protein